MMFLALFTFFGCDDHLFPAGEGGGDVEIGEGFCAVENLFESQCISCHSAVDPVAAPDLETDPSIVVTDLNRSGEPYLIPGDSENSYLYGRLTGDVLGPMPPTGSPSDDWLVAIASWIDDGADTTCVP